MGLQLGVSPPVASGMRGRLNRNTCGRCGRWCADGWRDWVFRTTPSKI
jgi:hypothetical protein